MKFICTLMILSFMISCNSGKREQSKPKTQIIPAEPSKFAATEDCFEDRYTVKIVSDRSAKVLKAGNMGILDCYEIHERYQTCTLPDWAVEGTEVQISGVVKNVRENERLAGTPFLISEIHKK